jgi:glycosyltransferase involved in cell wall biosynthesis
MSIVIFGDVFTFPDGQAATNRVYTYAKGFKENGKKVYIVCFTSLYLDTPNGVVDGIPYYHPFQQKKRNKYFLIRRWQNFLKYIRTYKLLKKINKEDKIETINRWSNLFLTHLICWVYCKFLRTKLVTECSEHPLGQYQGGGLKKRIGIIKFRAEAFLSDGILCISQYLVDFHTHRGISPKKLFHIPSTVDPSRFVITGKRPISKPYIGYFGSLSFKRDNVDLLINAFANFCSHYPQVQLVLGGFCSEDQKIRIQELIAGLDIKERVQIINYLTRQQILQYITHADILVMVRSKDLDSDASYPSKLTEFLATGNPVISVKVGEITDFLTDGKNAFLVEPGNVQELTDKLKIVFDDYELAQQVAIRGKELADTTFNYNYQSKRIIDFISSLNK